MIKRQVRVATDQKMVREKKNEILKKVGKLFWVMEIVILKKSQENWNYNTYDLTPLKSEKNNKISGQRFFWKGRLLTAQPLPVFNTSVRVSSEQLIPVTLWHLFTLMRDMNFDMAFTFSPR